MNKIFDKKKYSDLINFICTDNAINKIKKLMIKKCNFGLILRIFIHGGGCSGFKYGFVFDKNINKDDVLVENYGIKLLIDFLSYQYLIGSTLDYKNDLMDSKFIINNPNVKNTCNCGSSFSV